MMIKNKNEEKDKIKILFRPIKNNTKNVRIFGKEFVKNNKDNCYIEYKGEKYEVKEYIEDIDDNYNHQDELYLILIGIQKITDLSYIFANCNKLSLIKISYEEDLVENTKETFDIKNISINSNESNSGNNLYDDIDSSFMSSSSLNKINTDDDINDLFQADLFFNNITKMNHLFYNCQSLKSLPDIAK